MAGSSPTAPVDCSAYVQLSEAYRLYGEAVGSGSGTASVAADHLRTVAKLRARTKAPREALLVALRLADAVTALGASREATVVVDCGSCRYV